MPVSIKFSAREFDNGFKKALTDEINDVFRRAKPQIEQRIKNLVEYTLVESPEVKSLIGGRLRGDFGFVKGEEESYVFPVIQYIVSRINVHKYLWTYQSKTIYDISLLVVDLEELTGLPKSSYISSVNVVRNIEWLKWLLSYGSAIIVTDFEIDFTNVSSRSRSGIASMVRGRGWRVPAAYAGTMDDNWLTRAINPLLPTIALIIEDVVGQI